MKQGDVFVIDGLEPLFIAETVTPSGTVYAHHFDINKGTHGRLEAFPANTKLEVLFNSAGLSGSFSVIKIGSTTLKDFVVLRRKSFQLLATESRLKETLEDKMRPGAYSAVGFLGITESLEKVLKQDEQTLKELGITFEKLAFELEKIVGEAWEIERKCNKSRELAISSFEWVQKARLQLFPPILLVPDNLPDRDIGNIYNEYQVFFTAFRGIQECPWDCQLENTWSSFDFLLINRKSGEYLFAPGLIIHLIREHHFFEGKESPYRVEPFRLARVLGLV
jgi:hypothetical protein